MTLSPSTATKRYLMIGAPITSVRTPPLLEAYLASLGITAEIAVRHLEPADLPAFMEAIAADRSINGLIVTMPHKKAIMPYLQLHAKSTEQTESANAVKRLSSGSLAGAQFDGIGLVKAVLAKGVALGEARVLLAGVGGAGLAIAHAVSAHGCKHLDLIDLDQSLLERALDTLRAGYDLPISDAQRTPGSYDLLINATPLGMKPDDPSPFETALVESASAVADIVADPNQTRLEALARAEGRLLITGREMVQSQVQPIGRWLLADGLDEN